MGFLFRGLLTEYSQLVNREVSKVSDKSQSRLKNKVFLSKAHLTEIHIFFHIFNVAVGGKGESK